MVIPRSRSAFSLSRPQAYLKRAFAHLLSFLFELLDDTLVDAAAFVNEMAGGGRFAGVDVANHHDVDVQLFFTHFKRYSTPRRKKSVFNGNGKCLNAKITEVLLNKLKLLNYKLPPC